MILATRSRSHAHASPPRPPSPRRLALAPCLLCALLAACTPDPAAPTSTPPADTGDCVDLTGDGCGDPDAGDPDADPDATDATDLEPAECVPTPLQSALLQSSPDLAAGLALGVRLADDTGAAPTVDLGACLTLAAPGTGAPIPARFTLTRPDEVRTLVLIWPGADPARAVEAARTFVASRPFGESVAVAVAGPTLWRWTDFDLDTAGLAERMAAAPPMLAAPPEALPTRVAEAVELILATGTPGSLVARQVVVIAPEATLHRPWADTAPEVATFWMLAQPPADVPPSHLAPPDDPAGLSDRLEEQLSRGYYRGRACAPPNVGLAVLEAGGAQVGALRLPPAERRGAGACALDQTPPAPDAPGLPLSLDLDDAQRAVYADRVATLSREDFALAVRPAPGFPPTEATAHLRGQSSLGCDRKSYAVHVAGSGVPWLPGLERDEVDLLSMCLDQLYINQLTGDTLMAQLGVFPLRHGLRELEVDGAPRGVYLVMDKPEEAARSQWSAPRSVIRRLIDIDGKGPELKFAAGTDAEALAEYQAVITFARSETGEPLLAGLRDRMDLDGYLRWIALMSLLHNGDYVDEVWFVGTTERDATGAEHPRFHVIGWDPDDLFSECHHNSRFAIEDPHGLLYCTESVLDHAIFADPVIYARYVETLDALMDLITPELFTRTLEVVGDRLLRFFERDAVRGAMSELLRDWPEASTAEGARATVIAGLQRLQQAFVARVAELRAAIATWRETHP